MKKFGIIPVTSNPESTAWNPESRTLSDFPTLGEVKVYPIFQCVCKILKLNAEKNQKGSFPLPDVGEIVVGIEDALTREVNAQSGLDKNIYEKKQTSR